jgi:LmbE family N-acetylglucosaminyl deacetylase
MTLAAMLLLPPAKGQTPGSFYPRVAHARRGDRVLIVAPHVDDEVIAAGGYAADALASGAEVFVVFLTAGDGNRYSARVIGNPLDTRNDRYLAVGHVRIGEAKHAMQLLGVARDHFFILGYPDSGLSSILEDRHAIVRARRTGVNSVPYSEALTPGAPYRYDSVMNDMRGVLAAARPTIVIAPVAFDTHPDHRAAAEITDLALQQTRSTPYRLGYLVHSARLLPAFIPTPRRERLPPSRMRHATWATYPLTASVQKTKDRILATYKSQGIYTFILRNEFNRRNELFYVYPSDAEQAANLPAGIALPHEPKLRIAR